MNTVTLSVRPCLANYLYVRYQSFVEDGAIKLPARSTLYHNLLQLTAPRPAGVSWRETGNLTLALPWPDKGKDPRTYNYLSAESVRLLEKQINLLLHMDFYEALLEGKFRHGIPYKRSMYQFMETYHLEDMNEEALIKSFQLWRKKEKEERAKPAVSLL